MDIFNRIPSISEDTIQFFLYPPTDKSDETSVTTYATCIQLFVESLLPDFIWHRDPFGVKVVSDPDGQGWSLEGRMRVGDSIDDEWCVVWLLREISAQWDVAISVFDSDGDFLLIEAAEVLPSWVKPSNSENRVWIYGSHLHLIPLLHVSPPSRTHRRRSINVKGVEDEDTDDDFIAVQDAVKLIRDVNTETLAPPEVAEVVWRRISSYPMSARGHVHITKAYVPVDIAKALSVSPALVQKPVETFYTRDAIQLRAAHRMARFPPEPSVLCLVKMTRTAYAQLVGQKFHPPKIFGRWQEKEGTPQWRWRDVGMKIACGFEMLYQESKSRTDALLLTGMQKKKDTLRCNAGYARYIEALTSIGYFKGEREGSQLWNALEDKAASALVEVKLEDEAARPSFANLVTTALSQVANGPFSALTEEEDSDAWLNIDAEDFDNMLEKTMGTNPPQGNADNTDREMAEDRLANEQASKLQTLAGKVEEFIEGEGTLEGALFEDEEFSEEEEDDADDSDDSDENPSMDQQARRAAMDKLVPGLDSTEYGQMPASFYRRSQRVAPTTMDTAVEEASNNRQVPPRFKPIRQPILPRDKFEGVDSDDETDEDDESEEDQPQVVGDMELEIDMEEEEAEFIEFSQQALGITSEQWNDIVRDRRSRGAFVPSYVGINNDPSKPRLMQTDPPKPTPKTAASEPTFISNNPNLKSFEAVMQAMDAELLRSQVKAADTETPASKDKGKGKQAAQPEKDEDIEAAMDAELRASLEGEDSEEEGGEEGSMDYNLIKNFLESFKSQTGLSGPVGNIAGRLQPGWTLPRDDR